MAPGGDAPAARSGGKILKEKRIAARKTPYDRPTPPQPQHPPESPNWLTGLVSPAKFVAGGASKILSSIWNPTSWDARSVTSSDSDDESEDDSGDDENPSDGVIELSKKLSQKQETLHLIEQLLVHEHFSREERDRLIEIINSRVVDAGPSMIHSSANNETYDIHSQAIMEAKKWVAENKVRSGLRSDFDNGIFALKSITTPQATEADAGSPIDVAKSYMKARPPWASPINHDTSLTSPSPLAADLFKERTPFSSGAGISFSSAKSFRPHLQLQTWKQTKSACRQFMSAKTNNTLMIQKDYLSAGSWNIQEEIRRVRTKATEDLLNSHRSVKLALSSLEHDTPKHSSANETSIIVAGRTEQIILETPKSVDEVVNLAAEDNKQNGAEKEEDTRQPNDGNPDHENDTMANDINQAEDNNCFFMTESPDIPVSNSQDSFNTDDQSQTTKKKDGITGNQVVTRASRSTRRGRARGK